MSILSQINLLLRITHSNDIMRRYFVVNGFDGALTMMGLMIGFLVSIPAELSTVINVCLGTAIALAMSGVSSAYVSESAERQHALGKLEEAMISDLHDSAYGDAMRWTPLLIALVNGLSPLLFSLLILIPLLLSNTGMLLPISPLYIAIIIALVIIFLLGSFIGRIAKTPWWHSGIRTLLVAIITASIIFLFTGY